jgi:transposase
MIDLNGLPSPELSSVICARTLETQRALNAWTSEYGHPASDSPLQAICLMHVLTAPWHTAEQLRVHNRMTAWLFHVDNVVEGARTLAEAEEIIRRYRLVVEGGTPDPADPLCRMLHAIWDELRTGPMWRELGDRWLDLFDRTLDAMRTERRRRMDMDAGGAPPTVEQYIANCDNTEVRIAYFTYWISAGDHSLHDHLDLLMPALWEAQVAVRWANDFRSIQRKQEESTALNSFMLGVGPAEIQRQALRAVGRCGEILEPLIAKSVPEAVILDRMMRSAVGFYHISDYKPEGRD